MCDRNSASSTNRVCIWIVDFRSIKQVNDLEELLSLDELKRANRFAHKHLRDLYVIARGYLRRVLSTWVSVDPKEIKFRYSPYGKPEIEHPQYPQVQFNLSHSGDFFAIAISNSFPVGIDIEFCCPKISVDEIALQIMTSTEYTYFSSLNDSSARRRRFFNTWTAKESFVKAIGTGFTVDPRLVEVDYLKGNFIFKAKKHNINPKDWHFSHCEFKSSYSLAISSPLSNLEICYHNKHY